MAGRLKKNMKAEEAVALEKSLFRKWVRETPSGELERVFHCCSMNSNGEKWELAKIELNNRSQKLAVRISLLAAVAAIVAAIASIYALFVH